MINNQPPIEHILEALDTSGYETHEDARGINTRTNINKMKDIFAAETFEEYVHRGNKSHIMGLYMPKYSIVVVFDESVAIRADARTVIRAGATDDIFAIIGRICAAIHDFGARVIVTTDTRGVGLVFNVPPEILLTIVKWARKGNKVDRTTLQSLTLVSKTFCRILRNYRNEIIEHYTVGHRGTNQTWYSFCGMNHNNNDLPVAINNDGSNTNLQYWYRFGKRHRDNDKPAMITSRGGMTWVCHGKVHRDNDKPASIDDYGNQYWYMHGKHYRADDKPATILKDGTQMWYQCGPSLHRKEDKPAIIYANGTQEWYQYGKLHRGKDKPAVIKHSGTQKWYQRGKRHRAGGKPAIIRANGEREWWVNGSRCHLHGL